ncbi:trace amine-associated receptor 13c-like [Paramacrobiotus metropolitanus]|uniref:trace amine-associated receptor 13c-like n=1 Tax=Paramacrobiotus metropolitanus TaxID=2943436 RepID=UPI0024456DC9|nr:trace amine-associated receptor 13c-like [Paramacrobiotus metropolitanus]
MAVDINTFWDPQLDCACTQRAELTPYYVVYIIPAAAFLANFSFCASILSARKLRTFPNLLLISDAVADFGLCSIIIPLRIRFWLQDDCWSAGHTFCQFFIAASEYFNATSLAHAAAISVERHVRLFHPSFHRRWVRSLLIPAIFLCWIFPTLFTYAKLFIPSTFGLYPYHFQTNDTCTRLMQKPCVCVVCLQLAVNAIDVIGQNIAPLCITFAMYGHMIFVAYRRIQLADALRRRVNNAVLLPETRSKKNIARRVADSPEFRSIRVFVVILLVLFGCVMPSVVSHFYQMGQGEDGLATLLQKKYLLTSSCNGSYGYSGFAIPAVIWSNSLINPLLLFMLNRNYRKGFKIFLGRFQSCYSTDEPTGRTDISIPSSCRWNRINVLGEFTAVQM